ncbi:hypothetical protein F511_38233 [Dorcoceras hygrometricum]|uniref:Uncharacterized protein n=1 Tax=Dorcoceras hygrometricum TaxID=472368 RepID=A0A2Z7DBW0_9LAMI|nr:hypothetical protein F511_38233 [Dorcoceras hygrometricum]
MPHTHLGTPGPSNLLEAPAYDTKIGKLPEDSLQDRGSPEASLPSRECFPRTMSRCCEESCPYTQEDLDDHGGYSPRYSIALALYKYQTSRRSTSQSPVSRRSRAPRRGGVYSSAEIIWLHQLVPSVGSVEERQDATQEE